MVKRIFIGIAGLACFAAIAFVVLIGYVILGMPTFRSLSRAHEKLPAIFVENGDTVYFRMQYDDFRFPLPSNVHIVRTNLDSGGYFNGAIYVIGTNGAPVNLRDYAEFLQKKHWDVTTGSGAGCESVTNNRTDVPFVSSSGVIHYPLFDEIYGSSSNQVGGTIIAATENGMTKIRFSYFSDN